MLTLFFNCCNFPAAFKDFRCIVHGFIEIYIVIRTYACLVQLFGIQLDSKREVTSSSLPTPSWAISYPVSWVTLFHIKYVKVTFCYNKWVYWSILVKKVTSVYTSEFFWYLTCLTSPTCPIQHLLMTKLPRKNAFSLVCTLQASLHNTNSVVK